MTKLKATFTLKSLHDALILLHALEELDVYDYDNDGEPTPESEAGVLVEIEDLETTIEE